MMLPTHSAVQSAILSTSHAAELLVLMHVSRVMSSKSNCHDAGTVGMPAAKTGTLIDMHSGLYVPDPRGRKHV